MVSNNSKSSMDGKKVNKGSQSGLRLQPGYYEDEAHNINTKKEERNKIVKTAKDQKQIGSSVKQTSPTSPGLRLQAGTHRDQTLRMQLGHHGDSDTARLKSISSPRDAIDEKTKLKGGKRREARQNRISTHLNSPTSKKGSVGWKKGKGNLGLASSEARGEGGSDNSCGGGHGSGDEGWDDGDESMQPGAIAEGGTGYDMEDDIIVGSDADATDERVTVAPNDEINSSITEQPEIKNATLVNQAEIEEEIVLRKAEEIRNRAMINSVEAKELTYWERNRSTILVAFGAIFVILAIVLGLVLSNRDNELTGMEYLIELLSPISGRDVLTNETTSQYMTLEWLASEDTLGITLDATNQDLLLERYIVALLYFSMGGIDWKFDYNFLSNSSVCEWVSTPSLSEDWKMSNATNLTSSTNEGLRVNGVRCNSDGSVNQIRLGKLKALIVLFPSMARIDCIGKSKYN